MRCVIVAGGDLEVSLPQYDFLICADSGYRHLRGVVPDLIVGDFDSYKGELPDTEIMKLPSQKDETDLYFACKEAVRRGAREVILLGVTGDRPDHTYAAYSCLQLLKENDVKAKIITKNSEITLVSNETLRILKDESYVSVLPFGGCAEVTLKGFLYPLKKTRLSMSFPVGVSNEFVEDIATVKVRKGSVLIMKVKK